MRITLQRKEFTDTLNLVIKAVAVKSQTPILSGIYLKASDGVLEVQATDNAIGIVAKLLANIEENGEVVITGKKFFEVVQKFTDDTITILHKQGENTVEISSAGSKFDLLMFPADDYPKMKVEENLKTLSLRQGVLKKLLKQTTFAASDDKDGRMIFRGVLFKIQNDSITLAATNTHRLAVAYEKTAEPFENESEVIVPAKILSDVIKFLNDTGNVEIAVSDTTANFKFDNMLITTRIIEGVFPDFNKVFPKETTITVNVGTKEFLQAVERVAVISKETDYNTINLFFGNERIKIYASSATAGRAEEIIQADVTGGELDIGFYCNYVTDVLKVIDTEKIVFGLTEDLKPAEIKAVGDDSFRYIVTPVRRE